MDPKPWRVGPFDILRISDGVIGLPTTLFPNAAAEPEATAAMQRAAGITPGDPMPTPVNTFALRGPGGGIVLIDAGTGPHRGEALGHVPRNLRAAGMAPEEVETILMTHLHGDHAGGLLDAALAPVFAKARILVPAAEVAFWSDSTRTARLPAYMAGTIAMAERALSLLADRIIPFEPEALPVPGITAVPLPGHTPGHTGYRFGEGAGSLFLWTDIVHVAAFQFARPDWTNGFDADPVAGTAMRQKVMAELADSGETIIGMHLPSRGRVEVAGEAFRFVPIED
ncbi:glyoxylase-like metal-dependent hydrolase (beta-lactamase superfamily II) [Humitalea rosea]|uniref:Glyoxylase-like metal-dependent hydrolase (Beta-lactamase superfamily II) n=1 Tax=Humitalea rosea TaxID=990373 RepID=A0A2W7I7L7_9PROT|nr:MBL fold metallo-hydrolase [Humitalea rosea]PZW42158.1 glyoxylase-like metal-dependent hydrolase (beta-lactamase superfamily II) [Humitalea rosea]